MGARSPAGSGREIVSEIAAFFFESTQLGALAAERIRNTIRMTSIQDWLLQHRWR